MLFIRRRHPVEQVHLKLLGLVAALNRVLPQLRAAFGERSLAIDDLQGPESNYSRLRMAVYVEFKSWSGDGETSQIETDSIVAHFGRFEADLKRVYQRLAKSDRQLADDVLKKVIPASDKLGGAIQNLRKAIGSGRVRVARYHTDYPEEFYKIRQAMAKFNPKAAQQLKGMAVDRWCDWPGLELENPLQEDLIAKLVLASREQDQSYELRYRSKSAGRPLLLMKRFYDRFPSEDQVIDYAGRWDNPDKIYVAVAKPTWRVVWIFDRETVGW